MEKGKRTARQSAKDTRAKAEKVVQLLEKRYATPETHLVASNAWELLVATVLSAQCTDVRVNMVTPDLFARWPNPRDLAEADLEAIESCIRSTGFYRNKAKNIKAAAQRVVDVYGGEVPRTMQELITLPGVARKTANVVLWNAFGKNEGIAVDTHVARISFRLGLTQSDQPVVIEKDLMAVFPQAEWGNVNHRLVWFGRHVCEARNPLCTECELEPYCDKNGVRQQRAKK